MQIVDLDKKEKKEIEIRIVSDVKRPNKVHNIYLSAQVKKVSEKGLLILAKLNINKKKSRKTKHIPNFVCYSANKSLSKIV